MSGEKILEALRALGESDREKGAPPEVEARLLLAFRRNRRERVLRRAGVWAVAAAAVVVMVVAYARRPRVEPARVAVVAPQTVVEKNLAPPAPVVNEPVVSKVKKRRVGDLPHRREIVTEFFPLMDIAPPFERGQLVRVNLPAAAMRTVGLPVREDRLADRVQADVLVGEEGLARAIRFVKYSQ
jgi:hypothetical protein